MKWLVSALAAVLIAVLATVALSNQAATAGDNGARLFHYIPDNGYDAGIRIACMDGTRFSLQEGDYSSSNAYCGDHGVGVRSIYIRDGEELWTKSLANGNWYLRFDATGWHPVDLTWSDGAGAVLQLD